MSLNQAMVKALRGHVDAVVESATAKATQGSRWQAARDARPAAVAWVYSTALVAWAEDHHLIDPWLRADAEPARKQFTETHRQPMAAWVARGIASLCVHPAMWCLLDPRYTPIRDAHPSDDAVRDLVRWWSEDAPSFAYDATGGEPSTIAGFDIGDLLQALSDERRRGFALAQSPWWLADFLIDRTLLPAADEFRDETLRTIDPTCGTGNVLIRKIDCLWELYTTGTLRPRSSGEAVTGWTPVPPAEAIRRIIAGVDGCEIDPLTAAVAHLRFVVAIGDLMHRSGLLPVLRLDSIPPFQPRIVVGDSLLAGKASASEYAKLHPRLAEICNLGYPDPVPIKAPVAAVFEQGDLFADEEAS